MQTVRTFTYNYQYEYPVHYKNKHQEIIENIRGRLEDFTNISAMILWAKMKKMKKWGQTCLLRFETKHNHFAVWDRNLKAEEINYGLRRRC